MAEKKQSLGGAVSSAVKAKFDLDAYKKKRGLDKSLDFKEQDYIPFSPALADAIGIPGIPLGQTTLLRGHSDTGKTTALIEVAVSAQQNGILPVFIITEMKWDWSHVEDMGFDRGDGFYLYIDRESINTIEDVGKFILDTVDDQHKGKLPYDLIFLWDSVGSIQSEQSAKANKSNNQWNAGALSNTFAGLVNQKITLSRKKSQDYTNTLVCVNKVWTAVPESPVGKPRMMNKGGTALFYDSGLVITFGNVSSSGVSKLRAIKGGKHIEFGKRVNVQVDKSHVFGGISAKGKVIVTPYGFIKHDDKAINEYKKTHAEQWAEILGGHDYEIAEVTEESLENDQP